MNLSTEQQTAVLQHLNLQPTAPDRFFLDRLVNAYIRKVPWESAFRIARRARLPQTAVYPRWPDKFWQEAITLGGGGTCFESNYAFFTLLQSQGYAGYLTINNMGDSIGCHTAIIILLAGQKWLVDVGLPVHAPLPISPRGTITRPTAFMRYTVIPEGSSRYRINRDPHPQRDAFTLIDTPVPEGVYRQATAADYGPDGYFLDRIVVNKVVEERLWRFNSADRPFRLEAFHDGQRLDYWLEDDENDVVTAVSNKFDIDAVTISAAFAALKKT